MKKFDFKLSLTIFPDTVQSGKVSKLGPVSPSVVVLVKLYFRLRTNSLIDIIHPGN
jgi:hypothetical protein